MRLFRYEADGRVQPGVELENGRHVSAVGAGIQDYTAAFLADGGIQKVRDWLSTGAASKLSDLAANGGEIRFLPPIADTRNFICIGLNYRKHAQESGMTLPGEPVIFLKHTGSITRPNGTVIIPRDSEKTDYEVELGVVVLRRAHCIKQEDALDYVAGYVVVNDVSERNWQLERPGGQWDKGKAFPSFAPVGPYLVPAREVSDPQDLRLWLEVNGERRQDSNTSDMHYSVAHLVWYCSQCFELLPGDIISTGTPQGVGHGFQPPKYLQPGDEIRLGIDGLGEQHQRVIAR